MHARFRSLHSDGFSFCGTDNRSSRGGLKGPRLWSSAALAGLLALAPLLHSTASAQTDVTFELATDALVPERSPTVPVAAGPEVVPERQEMRLNILGSQTPDGAPGPPGTMTVVHTSASVPEHVTWIYEDGSSDQGFGVPLPGTGAIAVSFGAGVKSIHLYRLRHQGGDSRSIEGRWAPALAGTTIRQGRLTPKDGVLAAKSFHIEDGGTLSIDRITSSSALRVQWTFPTGEMQGIGVMLGTYLAAVAIDPEDRGGVALYYMMGNGPRAISRWVINGSAGVGKEELVMAQADDASAKSDPSPASDFEAEVRTIAETLRQDLGNATRWKPTTSQINSISATKADADKLRAYVKSVYADLLPGEPAAAEDQTEILVRGPDLGELAGGYRNKKRHFRPGIAIYGFKFVEPGKDTGMVYDGLIHVNGEWIFIPKAWRAFR